jgi:anti-sigma regulatory factor (Ser/Thr protein kinase)
MERCRCCRMAQRETPSEAAVQPTNEQNRLAFYRLATIGWANRLLRETVPLLTDTIVDGLVLDLSDLVFADSFGVTYLAACFHVATSNVSGFVRPPRDRDVNEYLLNVGLYEASGLGGHFRPRTPSADRVDLIHVTALEPVFIDHLLDFLEKMQPFEEGLRQSMRMALLELLQNFVDHSGSETGAWISGQLHRQRNRITLCVLDLGRGIPNALRTIRKYRRFRDASLVELATEEGVSSVAGSSRGLGLNTIRRFVRSNGGVLTILSRNGYVTFRADRRPMRKRLDVPFPGTAVFLSLVPTSRGLFVL